MDLKFRKFQTGGQVPPELSSAEQESATVQDQGGTQTDILMLLAQMAVSALESGDCNTAMQVCQGFVQLMQSAQGGAPAAEQTEPVYRKGGTLVRRIKK